MSVTRSEHELLEWLRSAVADLLDLDPDAVDPDRALTELGISSRDAVGLVGELEDYLDRDLDATLVWKMPTISAIASSLSGDGPLPASSTAEPAASATGPATSPAPDGEPADARAEDPIVVVGLGCRLPGDSTGPDAFWSLLREGRDAVGEVPEGRWEDFTSPSASDQQAVARMNRTGGFLGDVAGFDAEFFGISPREAELMDPQQRMLLEVTQEALAHAGIAPERLRGSHTGVYVGMSTNEYSHLAAADLARVDAWTATGSAFSIAANRLSYLMDLRGPSLTLDTACSSSLVAVHQARTGLEAGDIDTAIVAGVNLLLSPAVTITFDQAGALAPAGGCKPFSADADGIARAEGVGVVVLKRLSTALADGDRPLAIVRGSGVNQDGRSNGLTAPNPQSQEDLLRAVYAKAGIAPGDVDYIEAHGTGTLLGDPIEAGALGAALGEGRPADRPLLLGSVKSNLGHLESAAGMAGLIKVVLGMTHDLIPASLKYSAPNPHIRFDDWRLEVVDEPRPWPRYGGTAIAGVSGFGFGGTNAHVVLEEYAGPVAALPTPDDDAPVALTLSAANDERVRAQAGALASWLEGAGAGVPMRDVAHTLVRRRGRGAVTSVLAARGRTALIETLRRHAAGQDQPKSSAVLPKVPRPTRPTADAKAVWVFSGWGSQWAGMAARLLQDEPVFAAAVDELDPLVEREAGFSLRAAIEGTGTPVRGVAAIQIALFGIQVSLAALWRSLGAEPAAVIGHSMGEVAAAVVAGGLSLEDGVRVIAQRSVLLEKGERAGAGAMAVVDLDPGELERLAERFPEVVVCVYGAPSQLTVGSSNADQLGELVAYVESLGRNAFPLKVRGAAHSHMVDPILGELAEGLAGITPRTAAVPMYSTALTDPRTTPAFDVDYWLTNIRRPVRFSQAVVAAAEDGHQAYLEISPHPVALHAVKASAASRVGAALLTLPTLRRDADDTVTFRAHALALAQAGYAIDLDRVVPAGHPAGLPGPVWLHRRFWVESVIPQVPAAAVDGHPLLGVHVELPEGGRHLWRADAGTQRLPWLDHHQVYGVPVLPVAGYAEMALAAGREILAPHGAPEDVVLTGLELLEMMTLGEHTDVTTSLTLDPDGSARVELHARPPGAPATTAMARHAVATVRRAPAGPGTPDDLVIDLTAAEEGREIDLYATMKAGGHEYGPSFVGVRQARLSASGVATARLELPESVASHLGYTVHPVLLDIALQSIVVSALSLLDGADVGEFAEAGAMFLPVGVGRVRVHGDPGRGGLATASVRRVDDGLSGSVRVVGDDGRLLIEVADVRLRRIGSDEIRTPLPDLLFESVWEPVELPSDPGPVPGSGGGDSGRWLLVDPLISERGDGAGRLTAALGGDVERVSVGELAAAVAGGEKPRGVLLLAPTLTADEDAVGGELGARTGFRLAELVYAMAEAIGGSGLDMTIVTVDGLAARPGELGRPALAALGGQVRALALAPDLAHPRLVDLDGAAADPFAALAAELAAPGPSRDDEVAWRDGTRLARRVRRAPLRELGAPFALRPGGYVLTDALAEPGLHLARWLAGRLAGTGSRLVLGAATADTEEIDQAIDRLSGTGTLFEVVTGDPADHEVVKRMVEAATAGDLPLRGLIQAPRPAAFAVPADQETASAQALVVTRAAWCLHQVAAGHDLDVWCLRSTSTALLGPLGADPDENGRGVAVRDGAVGAWLDALVDWRRGQGLPGASVQWGRPEPGQAAEAFALLGPERSRLGVVRVPADRLAEVSGTLPYFSELAPAADDEGEDWIGPEGLRALPPAEARQRLADRLRSRVALVMGHRPEDVDVNVPLSSLGVDSLMAMRAKNAVEHDVGVTMPVRLLLQGASLSDLEAHLAAELGIDVAPAPVARDLPRADVEARDGVERWLVAAWELVIGRTPSGVTAPTTELGDAAAAGRVAESILDRLEHQPGAADRRAEWPSKEELAAAATIEQQADLVRELIENIGSSPVRLLAAGQVGVRPLYVFHPAGGTTSVYYPMVSQLGAEVPVYGFERLGRIPSIEDKVAEYLRLIRQIQPSGPYRLGGWSYGGALAYRTAQHLREQGEEVELLFLIDTILARPDAQSEADMLAGRFERFIEYLETTYELDLEIDVRWLVTLDEEEQIDTLMRLVEESGANLSPALMEHQRTSYEDARAAEKFSPSVYGDGRVVLYRSTERGLQTQIDPRYARTEDSLGWDVYCTELEIVHVPGNHTSMIDRPQVDTMARHLSKTLLEEVRHA